MTSLPENLVRNPLLDIADIEYAPGTNRARKICCKSCSETVFEVPENPSQEETDKAIKDLLDHFKIAHRVVISVCGIPLKDLPMLR